MRITQAFLHGLASFGAGGRGGPSPRCGLFTTTATTISQPTTTVRMSAEQGYRVILLRHGESTWNKEGRYIGWTDVPLTMKGEEEARQAGEALVGTPYHAIDIVYTSYLKRAIKTAWIALQAMGLENLPCSSAWQLNERMYGLAGLTEAEAKAKYGHDMVEHWADSWDEPPPEVAAGSHVDPATDVRKYGELVKAGGVVLPRTESMKMTQERAAGYWEGVIKGDLRREWRREEEEVGSGGKLRSSPTTALLVSHANTIKCLMGHLDSLSPQDMKRFEVPRAVPIVYDLDDDFKPVVPPPPSSSPYRRPSGRFIYPKAAMDISGRSASNS